MNFVKITEQESLYNDLEKKTTAHLLKNIHQENKKVGQPVEKALPQIEKLVNSIVYKMKNGGRLIYIGAGTSGRLGILDASECPPTFGSYPEQVIGIIAGGQQAISQPVEHAEDSTIQGWKDLCAYEIDRRDVVVGIASSGTTPYVLGALKECKKNNIITGCICCNPYSPISKIADFPIEVIVGPEFVTGSTRMKAGTAQKLILNMITTATMIRLGHIKGNRMIDMQLTNLKLKERAEKMLMRELNISQEHAKKLLQKTKSIRKAIIFFKKNENKVF